MKCKDDIRDLFAHFPKTEFDAAGIQSHSYCSQSQLYRILTDLVADGSIEYRETGNATNKKRLWRQR